MNNKVIALVVILVVIVAGWLIYRSNGADINLEEGLTLPVGSGQEEGPAGEPVTSGEGQPASAVKEFTVSGNNFSFSPKTLSVNKGDTVKINFMNSGGMHDLVLDEFGVRTPIIQGGQTASITFVADKTGTFEYYCSVGSHRQMGMVGTLTVQ